MTMSSTNEKLYFSGAASRPYGPRGYVKATRISASNDTKFLSSK